MNYETPGPVEEGLASAISPIEEIIEDADQTNLCTENENYLFKTSLSFMKLKNSSP